MANKFVITVCFVVGVLFIKFLVISLIKHKYADNKRSKINVINNLVSVVLLIVVFNIWSAEMQKFAFSIAAFIVAIVLATREFIQCFIGFM